jgi:hypothetical protein
MLTAHPKAPESHAFISSEEKAPEPEYVWHIVGQGLWNMKSLTRILIERNADYSIVRYKDQLSPNTHWLCISSKQDAEEFFRDTPPKFTNWASLYTTGGGGAGRRMTVTVGKRSLCFKAHPEKGRCCAQ